MRFRSFEKIKDLTKDFLFKRQIFRFSFPVACIEWKSHPFAHRLHGAVCLHQLAGQFALNQIITVKGAEPMF